MRLFVRVYKKCKKVYDIYINNLSLFYLSIVMKITYTQTLVW